MTSAVAPAERSSEELGWKRVAMQVRVESRVATKYCRYKHWLAISKQSCFLGHEPSGQHLGRAILAPDELDLVLLKLYRAQDEHHD